MAVSHLVRVLAPALALIMGGLCGQASAQNWDGSGVVRFGVFGQGSFIDLNVRQPGLNQTASPDAAGVGISAGYDLRLGSFVIGAEADVAFDGGRSKASVLSQERYGTDYYSTVRGRLGLVVHPAMLVYATAGYAMLGLEYKQNNIPVIGGGGGIGNKRDATLGSFVYGGGLEYDLGWGTGFFEYLHSDVGQWDFRAFNGAMTTVDGTQDVIRVGLKFKVGHDFAHDTYRVPVSGGLK